MKWNATQAVSAVFALALAALLAGQAHAACDGSQRIKHDDVDCLEAGWTNQTIPVKGKAHARSYCSDYGRVVVKVDRKLGGDWTWHLTNSSKRDDQGGYKINGVYCCSDLSDLCDTSDMDDDGCLDNFSKSNADDTCFDASASFTSPDQCKIDARCTAWNNSLDPTSITVSYKDVRYLQNCNSVLTVGGC